jgi:hypothetical protein
MHAPEMPLQCLFPASLCPRPQPVIYAFKKIHYNAHECCLMICSAWRWRASMTLMIQPRKKRLTDFMIFSLGEYLVAMHKSIMVSTEFLVDQKSQFGYNVYTLTKQEQ